MDLEIAAQSRSATGKRNRQLRRTGQLPGVVYGKDTDSLAIQVEAKAFDTLYRAAGRTSLVRLHVDGAAKSAIIREVQRHPLSRKPLHVDFLVVDLAQEMEVDVPLVFTGEPPAVELTGGTLMTPIDHLRVRALPAEIPHEITVDVTPLVDLESSLHVRDLVIPENVHVQTDGDELIARVLPPRIEEEPEVEEEAIEGEGVEGEEGAAAAEGEAQPTDGEASGNQDEGGAG
jgi:large subunit ribosomal protein L25